MERRRSGVVRQGQRHHHQDLQAGEWMTASVVPSPGTAGARPDITGDGEAGAPRGFFKSRYGSTSLRVGVATTWLSIIVLLPLAAIVWQSAGGGWGAFWAAVTSNSAIASFRVTLTISI